MSASKSMYSSSEPKSQSAISYGSDRDRALSLSRTKISQLSQKLSNHQNSIDQDQVIYHLFILNSLKKKLMNKRLKFQRTKQQQGDESKVKLLKEQLQKV
ncbi:unnamed protein product [Paramecium primaurelia]|uniref:Uncharacterized protein n=1 Tax=Paramecium primaurelia TaxID=5886 RepID=A0A8S1K3Z1_PARPR|nr:unnamed protein product [Paramecium primaurelia]